jgi:hypothetical protein
MGLIFLVHAHFVCKQAPITDAVLSDMISGVLCVNPKISGKPNVCRMAATMTTYCVLSGLK